MAEKRIETVEMRAGDVKTGFGNPRKITKKKKDELRNSIETFGDFGSFIIDENDNIIGGNMRLSVIKEMDPDTIILCKRLIGYSETELRAINIKDNTHSGDWDMDLLADWTADLTVDLGEFSIIGAGAVVLGNIEPHCTAVGVPAKVIKRRADR